MLSIVVPAHDEEALLGTTLRAIHEAGDGLDEPYEVIVVDDASTDRTAEVAAAAGARVVPVDVRHISAARNAGARAATGEILVFVDADTLVTPGVVRAAVASVRNGAAGGGAAVRFDEPVPLYARLMLPPMLWVGRRLRLASGCFLFAARAPFDAIGGFDEAVFAGEEALFSRALGKQGPFVILGEPVTTSGRKLRTHSARRVLGTLAKLAFLGRRGVRDRRHLALWYGPRAPDA
jgi:glycosyltransferase involved in cell wall biosynthesis